MWRADDFVENFSNAFDTIHERADKTLSYCIVIYARDTKDRTEEYPDWEIVFKSIWNTGYFDRASIKEYITDIFIENNK